MNACRALLLLAHLPVVALAGGIYSHGGGGGHPGDGGCNDKCGPYGHYTGDCEECEAYVATEIIKDFEVGYRQGTDIFIQHSDSTGTTDWLAYDPGVDSNFGAFNDEDVSYSHSIDWAIPEPGVILSATLTIWTYKADGHNDPVLVENLFSGTIDTGFYGKTVLYSDDGHALDLAFNPDKTLDVFIEKNPLSIWCYEIADKFEVYKSELEICYDVLPPVPTLPVPEPSLALSMITGLFCTGLLLRRRR